MKVAILGATGQTGSIIVKGLLASTNPKYVRVPVYAKGFVWQTHTDTIMVRK